MRQFFAFILFVFANFAFADSHLKVYTVELDGSKQSSIKVGAKTYQVSGKELARQDGKRFKFPTEKGFTLYTVTLAELPDGLLLSTTTASGEDEVLDLIRLDSKLVQLWTVGIDLYRPLPVFIEGDGIYFAGQEAALKISLSTGKILWRTKLPEEGFAGSARLENLRLDKGRLLISGFTDHGDYKGKVRISLDAMSGKAGALEKK